MCSVCASVPLSSFLVMRTTARMVCHRNWLLWPEGLFSLRSCVEILTSKHDGIRRRDGILGGADVTR